MNEEQMDQYFEKYINELQTRAKENKRNIYRKDNIGVFKIMAYKYLALKTHKKSMGELCFYLGITRKTLSKYKQRNIFWRNCINEIKTEIKRYNNIMAAQIMADKLWIRLEKMQNKQKKKDAEEQELELYHDPLDEI